MVRAAALAACLLALAAGAAAAASAPIDFPVAGCAEGYMKLEFMAPRDSTDPIAKCLMVILEPLQSAGSHVPGLWPAQYGVADAPDPTYAGYPSYVECPLEARAPIQATSYTQTASQSRAQRLEGIRRAIIKAFASHVYGLDDFGNYLHKLEVNDLDYYKGVLMVKRTQYDTLMYVITENTLTVNEVLQDDDNSPVGFVTSCDDLLRFSNPPYEDAYARCFSNTDAALDCPANSYPVMVVLDLNEDDQKDTAFKICGLCPAGTYGDGNGCSTCPAGQKSLIGGGCTDCDVGTYSNAGSSVCIPCPTGTYADTVASKECSQCPEDTYSWIPGAEFCMRCVKGLPTCCVDTTACPVPLIDGVTGDGIPASTPAAGTTIVAVSQMGDLNGNGRCDLTGDYEIPAFTKCESWDTVDVSMKLAFKVAGDCSIQISPITDPTCADPTDARNNPDSPLYDPDVHQYGKFGWLGKIGMRGYYYWNTRTARFEIGSMLNTTANVKNHMMFSIAPTAAEFADMFFYAATTDPLEAMSTVIKDIPGPTNPEVCTAQLAVLGGLLGDEATGAKAVNYPDACPPGSYYDQNGRCPTCPVGFTCVGNDLPDLATVVPCPDNTYNPYLGSSEPCISCADATTVSLGYTSYAAAAQCDVDRVDLDCIGNRDHGYHCIPCAEGSVALKTVVDDSDPATNDGPADAAATLTNPALPEGATFCDACPSGSFQDYTVPLPAYGWQQPCTLCPADTYRAGDATPENNVCKPVPAGYRLKQTAAIADGRAQSEIELCPKGQVSFYDTNSVRIPKGVPTACAACTELDTQLGFTGTAKKWAHTYAPRKGMTQCIPCPGGTVPSYDAVLLATYSCKACPNGMFRDAYTVNDSCVPCGPGKEVGPSSKMDCTMCRAGTYMNATRAGGATTLANTCDLCPIHTYRPTMGALSCLPCPRGTQTSNTGNVECTACPIGYFNNNAGTACKPAQAGTFVNTTGANVTTPCPKGTWNNEQAQDNCNPCAPGKYSNTFGSTECKTCAAGTYSAGQATACKECRPGYFAPAGAAACSPCKPGTYAPVGTSATCKLCPKGYQCPTNAMKAVGSCPKGTFSNKEGNKQCTPCPTNTYSNGGGAAPTAVVACIKCAPGTNTRGLVGQSKCQVIRPQVKRLF
ncbi:von Willebrand factor type EGF andpentraxin domain-containing 1 Flags: Precursor [Micractinium conductrix]|uniref:von Willebrand factor type EGF andpentraxin domain-containing 1 Flags n=1 Tax=Micractinium conductrix TaxID=554055 RepID=A0A2P6VLK2_9CHLO|nr:von Willebrand factor type EGF andpentraxin domain-containing 1 Flags: Precursor [Micractinium conductrix]|eukprot:PSC74950.1 von Willebrand factor type EGF andpentraxin domain-containing 1 Flags: Precursor [Micractinium conductrix]